MPNQDFDPLTLIARTGQGPDLADLLIRIDGATQNWRRRMRKGELGQRALKALGLDLDLAQLDVLFAVATPDANAEGETMVATVAERLAIDPSRASRLVAEMVAAGHVRRTVSQADARRTILEVTEAGAAVVAAVRGYKWLLLGDFFAHWSHADIAAFVPLLERYSDWMRESDASEARFSREIADLAEMVRRAGAEPVSGG